MASRIGVFTTSVGTKILIGLSGLFLVFYLLIHIGGNLVIFAGQSAYNRYAFTLEHNKALLYPLELIILAGFLTHIYKTVTMFLANQQARPVAYAQKKRAGKPSRKTLASTTMIVYFRLFAGLTSFISNLWRSHFSAIGPAGTRASSFMTGLPQSGPRGR